MAQSEESSPFAEIPTTSVATGSEDYTDTEDTGDENVDIHRDVIARKRKQVKNQSWKQTGAPECKDGDTNTGGG